MSAVVDWHPLFEDRLAESCSESKNFIFKLLASENHQLDVILAGRSSSFHCGTILEIYLQYSPFSIISCMNV